MLMDFIPRDQLDPLSAFLGRPSPSAGLRLARLRNLAPEMILEEFDLNLALDRPFAIVLPDVSDRIVIHFKERYQG